MNSTSDKFEQICCLSYRLPSDSIGPAPSGIDAGYGSGTERGTSIPLNDSVSEDPQSRIVSILSTDSGYWDGKAEVAADPRPSHHARGRSRTGHDILSVNTDRSDIVAFVGHGNEDLQRGRLKKVGTFSDPGWPEGQISPEAAKAQRQTIKAFFNARMEIKAPDHWVQRPIGFESSGLSLKHEEDGKYVISPVLSLNLEAEYPVTRGGEEARERQSPSGFRRARP